MTLPVSYKAWLGELGNLFVGPDPVFGLADAENGDLADDDLVYNARLVEENGFPSGGLVPIFVPDSGDAFYFDMREGLRDAEYPILRYDYNTGEFEFSSPSFIDFLMALVRHSG